MATIAFDASFAKAERVILSKTFKQNCIDLDIWKRDFTVHVRREHIGSPGHYARVCHPDKAYFHVELNSNKFNLFDATSALGHELVHMRQYLDNRLVDHPLGVIWGGKLYPPHVYENRENYHDLPWEKEAWALQCDLHISAIRTLDKEQKKLCHPLQSNGLARLWVEKAQELNMLDREAA